MTEMNKINVEALENVTGGAIRTVHNDAVSYANIRHTPGLNGKIEVKKDGYVWYEIMLAGAYDTGWIAGSLIGF